MSETDTNQMEIDFTIARNISDTRIITAVREILLHEYSGSVKLDRKTLSTDLPTEVEVSKRDAVCLFTGLILNDAASAVSGGDSFADYIFEVDTDRASETMEEQYVARRALNDAGFCDKSSEGQTVHLASTLPPPIEGELPTEVEPLAGDLRRLFLDANSSVRIASPYFDPSPSVIGDIAALVNRGVRTKVLTRETESADENLRLTLNRLYEEIDASNHDYLRVRDLYDRNDQTGQQNYATHAKIAIKDRKVCYVGSANLTDTSLSTNFELGVLLRGTSVTTAIETFDTVFEFSRPVELPL